MIKKIFRMQCMKLFYNADFAGYNAIGSMIALAFGIFVLLSGSQQMTQEQIVHLSMSESMVGMLFLWICMYGCTIIKEVSNKTVNYEKMHGVSEYAMLIGRMIIAFANALIFVLVALIYQLGASCLYGYFSCTFLGDLLQKMLLTLVCLIHVNVFMMFVFFLTRNIVVGSVVTFIIQYLVPSVASNSEFLCSKGVHKIFGISQMKEIWYEGISNVLCGIVLISFLVSCGILFFVMWIWNRRREWK